MTSNESGPAAAATHIAAGLGLPVEEAVVLQASNTLVARLLPCDVVVRVAPAAARPGAESEIELASRLAQTGAPTCALDPRVAPRVYESDGFVVTFWTYYGPGPSPRLAPADYARGLERLHACMRRIDTPAPHFTDRIAEAQRLVGSDKLTPALVDADRELLVGALQDLRRSITARSRAEQLLHGEPHPGNLLATAQGPVFIDLETCCRGPVEFDLAHAPEAVGLEYPRADRRLLRDCRILVLAMVSAWRWDRDDRFPNGAQAGRDYVSALRGALAGGPATPP